MDINSLYKKILDLEKRIEALEGLRHAPDQNDRLGQHMMKQISAKEFLLSKEVSSIVEKTLALGYYLEHFAKISPFNINDMADVFRMAREKLSVNPSDMINKNVVKGHFMEAGDQKDAKKAWVLTATGERFVENNFKK